MSSRVPGSPEGARLLRPAARRGQAHGGGAGRTAAASGRPPERSAPAWPWRRRRCGRGLTVLREGLGCSRQPATAAAPSACRPGACGGTVMGRGACIRAVFGFSCSRGRCGPGCRLRIRGPAALMPAACIARCATAFHRDGHHAQGAPAAAALPPRPGPGPSGAPCARPYGDTPAALPPLCFFLCLSGGVPPDGLRSWCPALPRRVRRSAAAAAGVRRPAGGAALITGRAPPCLTAAWSRGRGPRPAAPATGAALHIRGGGTLWGPCRATAVSPPCSRRSVH